MKNKCTLCKKMIATGDTDVRVTKVVKEWDLWQPSSEPTEERWSYAHEACIVADPRHTQMLGIS